jgi:hypothetical protein
MHTGHGGVSSLVAQEGGWEKEEGREGDIMSTEGRWERERE